MNEINHDDINYVFAIYEVLVDRRGKGFIALKFKLNG